MYSLWPHQVKAEPLLTSGSAILWHEMRLGKTRSALHAWLRLLAQNKVTDLIVVTVSMAIATWKQEVQEMGLNIPVHTLYGEGRELKPGLEEGTPRIYLLNWEILPAWQRWLYMHTYVQKRSFVLVLDESHLYCRNASNNQLNWKKGKRYKAAEYLAQFSWATWLLSGTLMVKSGLDIFWQAKLLRRPANPFYALDAQQFGERYCKSSMEITGSSIIAGERQFLFGLRYGELKSPDEVVAKMAALSVLRMDDVADVPIPQELPRWIADLGQEWDFYRSDAEYFEEIRALVPIKTELAISYVQQLEQRPVVVFGWSVELTEAIAQRLKAPLIRGNTPPDEREAIRQDFQAGRIPILVGNMRSLGLGVSLSRADHFVFAEAIGDAALYHQCSARGRTLAKQRRIVNHHLLVAGTVDEFTWKRKLRRGQAIEELYTAAGQRDLEPELPAFKRSSRALV